VTRAEPDGCNSKLAERAPLGRRLNAASAGCAPWVSGFCKVEHLAVEFGFGAVHFQSIGLPSSADRSRTIRGSFCHALPIGCMRVFMTPSCNSAVTFDSRVAAPETRSPLTARYVHQLISGQHEFGYRRHQTFGRVHADAIDWFAIFDSW
jgi:hypothetical protein